MQKLYLLVQELEKNIAFRDTLNLNVSQAKVSWQIDHSLKVIIGVCTSLKNSNITDYKWKFNYVRTLIFLKNSIPRGKGKAPKAVQSFDEISLDNLNEQLQLAKELLESIKNLPAKSNFKHPYFGILNLKQTIAFLNIHTNHHLKIVKDITTT